MSNNQLHGKKYEDHIKKAFKGSAEALITPTDIWDIPSIFDQELGVPTSIKTSKNKTICLSDARRFFHTKETFRLIYSKYTQENNLKIFSQIKEYIITPEILSLIIGDLNIDLINNFHNEIKKYPPGKENALLARIKAKEIKKEYSSFKTLLKLNPKIDSKDQRRLQCSLNSEDLDKICSPIIYNDFYKDISTTIVIESSLREFNKNN